MSTCTARSTWLAGIYEWLRTLPEDECRAIGMRRISEINQLYGGNETLERLQRRHARFNPA